MASSEPPDKDVHKRSFLEDEEAVAAEAQQRQEDEEARVRELDANRKRAKEEGKKNQTTLSLDQIKRAWHNLPPPPSKYHAQVHKRVQREVNRAKGAYVRERERLVRIRKNRLALMGKESKASKDNLQRELDIDVAKEKRRFAGQRKLLLKTASKKDWYAKQVALEEVAKLKEIHLRRLKDSRDLRREKTKVLKQTMIHGVGDVVARSKGSIASKKKQFLMKGWYRTDMERHYEQVLEYEDSLGPGHSDSKADILHLLHAGGSNREFVLDAEADDDQSPTAMLYLQGILQ